MSITKPSVDILVRSLSARVVLISILVVSCSAGLQTSDVVGTYLARIPNGTEQLILKRDGSFEQVVTVGTSQSYHAVGRWELDARGRYITFDDNFISALDSRGQIKKEIAARRNAVYVYGVNRSLGGVTIFASDFHVYNMEKRTSGAER